MITLIQDRMPEESNDIRLNLENILTVEGSPGLVQNQIYGAALASAYTTGNAALIQLLKEGFAPVLKPEEAKAAKSASIIMAMNNVYYRSLHLAEAEELLKRPARLRMNVIGKPGIAKVDFELYCTSVSAINGCGMCLKSHIHELKKGGMTDEAIQSSLRIAAVIQATAHAMNLHALAAS